jgi:hypothetical protein
MIKTLYGKDDGQEFEIQGYVFGNKDTAEVVVLNTKTHRLSSVTLGYLDTMNAEDRKDLDKKLTEEAMEAMKHAKQNQVAPNGVSGMSPKQAEEHAQKTGVNAQGQKLMLDKETGKMVVHSDEVESSENHEHKDSLLDKAKHVMHSKK